MTVKELIEKLQEIGAEAEVFRSTNGYDFKKVKDIHIDLEGDVIID